MASGAPLERRGDELTVGNLARHDATVEQNDSSFCINLVQQERIHLAETAKVSKRDHADIEDNPGVQDLSKLYKPDIPSSAPPLKRFRTISLVNEPFRLYAKEAMAMSGITEGSLESVEPRTAAFDNITLSQQTGNDSVEARASDDEQSIISCDSENAGADLEFQKAAIEQMGSSRACSNGSRIANSARLRTRISRRGAPGAK